MPDKIKQTCAGCRALDLIEVKSRCKLSYKIKTTRLLDGSFETIPLEPCPKPLTFDAYFQITQARENVARVKKFNIDLKSIS